MKDNWIKMGNSWVSATKLPGIYRKKGGGFFVRGRVKDPMTGKIRNIKKGLRVVTELEALEWLENEKARLRHNVTGVNTQRQRFGDYAISLYERKVKLRELRSPTARERWKHTLKHLIGGTVREECRVPGFGELFVEDIRLPHIERWREGVAELIGKRAYSPHTANGWVAILKVILRCAARDLELSRSMADQVRDFDTTDHVTYSEEAPQSLRPEQVSEFLEVLRAYYPQHYAMAFLAFCTGLRPSSLRPIRRRGVSPDVLWDEGRLLVRRSQTLGNEVLQTTKQRTRYTIDLPQEVVDVLQWHVETQLTSVQQESELLFPSISGGFRTANVLNKPFADVSRTIGLGYKFTQRGMRRTFNDLARAAEVKDLVTRSISGHATERMQHHYSTVRPEEQVRGLGKVVHLMTASDRVACGPHGGPQASESGPQSEKPAASELATG